MTESTMYELAKAVLLKEQVVSVSLLQRRLILGYSVALALMDELEQNGVVTGLNAENFRTLTPQYKNQAIDDGPAFGESSN
ncbi:DNA translocase FtsK [Collimonas silvisoli]|uniref:DNA translocase FtsK n=1 Tax=Collimonas silvisoli TaxID=2825884 RepID=UPI001B8CBC39|nr:DNA translocase FtsK [Collimonas silvisoli]